MTQLTLPPAASEHLCDLRLEGHVAVFSPASQGFPGSSFWQPQLKGGFPLAWRTCKCCAFSEYSLAFQEKSQNL